MEFGRKQGYCNIALEIEETACSSKLSEVSSRIVGVGLKQCISLSNTLLQYYFHNEDNLRFYSM